MSVQILHLTNPTENDVARATHVLKEAFKDDVANQICIGGDMELNAPFHQATIRATLLDGQVHVAILEGRFVGVALWFPPTRHILYSEKSRQLFNDILQSFPKELSRWWKNDYIPGIARLTKEALGSTDIEVNAWSLQEIGVLPEYQRRGIGTLLFKLVDSQARGFDLCVESDSPQNVALYRSWGFTERGSGVIKGCSLFPEVFTSTVMLKDDA